MCVAFLNNQGEICTPPASKWDAGSSALPRLTLVPDQNDNDGDREGRGGLLNSETTTADSAFGSMNDASLPPSLSASVVKRLGAGAPPAKVKSGRWKIGSSSSTPGAPGEWFNGELPVLIS